NKSLSEVLTSIGENPKKYPTIFHLRNALLNEDKPFDPRLIYIALHNLVKYRSHFLNEHMEWASSSSENESTFDLIQQYLNMLSNVGYPVNNSLEYMHDETLNNIVQVLESNEHTNSDKRNAIKKLIGKEFHEPISLIVGLKSDMYKLFPNSGNAQIYQDEKLKISFTEEDITEVYEKLLEEEKLIIDQANKIFQHLLLSDLLSGFNCVAEAKVHAYNEFRDDLNLLKEIYNEHLGEKAYRDMFITTRSNQTKYKETKDNKLLCTFDRFLKIHASENSFYKELKKNFENIIKQSNTKKKDISGIQSALEKLNKNQFLQKQKSYLNAAIPHQNNVFEAQTILRNQQKFYPEISDEIIDKVTKIISFRIPYYIGPLIKDAPEHDFGWAIRKDMKQPVLPWSIDEVIDRSKSAEQFIQQMTSYCAYLVNEKVLPKHSLTYQLF